MMYVNICKQMLTVASAAYALLLCWIIGVNQLTSDILCWGTEKQRKKQRKKERKKETNKNTR